MKEEDVIESLISETASELGVEFEDATNETPYEQLSTEEMNKKLGLVKPTTAPESSSEAFADRVARVDANQSSDTIVPSVAGKFVDELTDKNPTDPRTINNELAMWKNRIGISAGRGLAANRLTNSLMGYNHRIVNNPVPVNREVMGMVMIVRPDMNFDENNIANSRKLSDMLSQDRTSIDYSIIAALDPMCPYTNAKGDGARLGVPCHRDVPFDNLQAFIPVLTSHCMNFSGIPDGSVDNWLSEEGIKREQYGMADSTHQVNYGYSVSTTFTNMVGDFIPRMADIWLEWMSGVKEGRFRPRTNNSIQRRIDYQTRAYILRFLPNGKLVRFSNTGVMWPQNDNLGSMATYDRTKAMVADDASVSLQWQAIGARHNDPLYMDAFNRTVEFFNPDMIGDPAFDEYVPIGRNYLRKLDPGELILFNYYGYPHIDIVKRRLDWYVYQVDYEYVMKQAGLL